MSRKQWGHGYHNGVEASTKNTPGYVGLYFYTFENGRLKHQGKITKDLGNGRYLATLFSWADGAPNGSYVIDDINTICELFCDHYEFAKRGAYLRWQEAKTDCENGVFDQRMAKNAEYHYHNFFDRYKMGVW
jgi:hypothetical protein